MNKSNSTPKFRSSRPANDRRPNRPHNSKPYRAPQLNTRAVAATVLEQVLYRGQLLDDAMEAGLLKIKAQDKGLLFSMCYGVLRWNQVLNKRILHLFDGDEEKASGLHQRVDVLLKLGIWQLAFGYAEYAAIHQCVEAATQLGLLRAKGFLNALLRRVQKETPEYPILPKEDSLLFNNWLDQLLQGKEFAQSPILRLSNRTTEMLEQINNYMPAIYQGVVSHHTQQPVIAIRVQVNRVSIESYKLQLERLKIDFEQGVFANSLIIRGSILVEKLPGFAVGAVTVQDQAAQCAAYILDAKENMKVLDGCAAPGGKATHMQELANNTLNLTALEVSAPRSRRLRENMGRMRVQGKVVVGSVDQPSEWWDGRAYDAILLDVPCSGTGVMRRNPDIPWIKKAEDIIALSSESLRMLSRIWPTLNDGGKLLFATCSVLPEENDFIIDVFLQRVSNAKILPIENIPLHHAKTVYGTQIIPTEINDGLYYCLIEKAKII